MLIYIMHFDIIYDAKLSKTIIGKHILTDYDNFGNKRNLVNIEAIDGQWHMYSNNNVSISFNGELLESVVLNPYNFYTLTVQGLERITLYTMPLYDQTFILREIEPNTSLLIGSSQQSDIVYSPWIDQNQLKIDFDGTKFVFENLNSNYPTYVNKKNIKSGILYDFDTLFVMGLKIIVCSNKILINNPNASLKINDQKIKTPTYSFIVPNHETDIRTFTDFYNDSDYYFKSPVFKPEIKELDLIIVDPPSEEEKDKSSVLITIIPMLFTSVSSVYVTISTLQKFRSGESSMEELITGMIFAAGFLLASIFWPYVERKYYNSVIDHENAKRKKEYREYLARKKKVLQDAIKEQKMVLTTTNLSLVDCKRIIENKLPELFSRNSDSSDFLNICLGVGDVELQCNIDYSKPDYMPTNNDLLNEVDQIINDNKIIHDVPYVFSLKDNRILAFILEDRNMYSDYMHGIFLQLMTLHSYKDLKLVVLTSNEASELSFLKDSNYCWSNDRSIRYFATNLEEAQQISSILERELNSKDTEKRSNSPYFLIICDSIEKYRNLNIIDDVIHSDDDSNFGLLMYDMKISNIPNDCINFVDISRKEGTVFHTNISSNEINHFIPFFISNSGINVDECSRMISNIPIKQAGSELTNLPDAFGFLQMYGVGNVEQLNAPMRWDGSNLSSSLAVPIGQDINGNLIYLDLHEKNHGPHGLIAGMTGSGKSELIVTYILSLAVNFRPDEVQFVLIDYKGGGLAGAFENRKTGIKLPHLVGTITNLDQSEMNRTLVSINSELHRRQKIFNETKENLNTGNIDIYKYQKLYRSGSVQEPLSHLFIICDEFAELKAQQPDFMDELISAARIGRSLGIHLILATQKPSGVVDDQIWSNARFKICCKVQTTEDSNEMIQRDDAAYLKQAGSFYLQVGYDEYFIEGQSAYSGFTYIPSDRILSKIDNDIAFIDNTGDAYKTISDLDMQNVEKREDLGEELTNILKYIISESEKRNYEYHQLWLDNIPQEIYYNNIIEKYDIKPRVFNIEPIIGEYDDPSNQEQGYVQLNLTENGNTFIAGSSGSGKNTLFSTIIYSTILHHNCEEVNIYIIDLGSEKLKKFQDAPQVGDVLTIEDTDKIKYLFYMLETEKSNRQQYYANNSGDFVSDAKKGKCPFPNILVMIYDIEVFKESFEDIYDDMLAPFTRNCAKYGIYFVICSNSASSLGYRVENNFPQKIMLNLLDTTDYGIYFDHPPIPATNPGRGIINIDEVPYEFQVSLIFEESVEEENFTYVFDQLNKFLKNPVKPVPMIPLEVNVDMLSSYCKDLTSVPLGINLLTAQVGYFDFSKLITLIGTSETKNALKFIESMITMLSSFENTNVIVLNALGEENPKVNEDVKIYDKGFKKIVSVLSKNIEKNNSDKENEKQFIIIALGYCRLQNHFDNLKEEDENVQDFNDLILLSRKNSRFKFILFDAASLFIDIDENKIFDLLDTSTGIWIGRGFDSQSLIESSTISNDVQQNNDSAVLVNSGKTEYIKYMK